MNNEVGKVYVRPWGTYQTTTLEPGYQVKVLTVNPGGRLSLQRHFKRSEHWVVVAGCPTISVGEEKNQYSRDQAIYIPVKSLHRIENLTDQLCVLIEVQVGDYLGEDDIERVDDVYGRVDDAHAGERKGLE